MGIHKFALGLALKDGTEERYTLDGAQAHVRRRAAGLSSRQDGAEAEQAVRSLLGRLELTLDMTDQALIERVLAVLDVEKPALGHLEVYATFADGHTLEVEYRVAGYGTTIDLTDTGLPHEARGPR